MNTLPSHRDASAVATRRLNRAFNRDNNPNIEIYQPSSAKIHYDGYSKFYFDFAVHNLTAGSRIPVKRGTIEVSMDHSDRPNIITVITERP